MPRLSAVGISGLQAGEDVKRLSLPKRAVVALFVMLPAPALHQVSG